MIHRVVTTTLQNGWGLHFQGLKSLATIWIVPIPNNWTGWHYKFRLHTRTLFHTHSLVEAAHFLAQGFNPGKVEAIHFVATDFNTLYLSQRIQSVARQPAVRQSHSCIH